MRPLALGVAALILLTGCSTPQNDGPLIVVTTNILGDVVSEIVGDEAEVMVLMRPNADPHSFEISAQEAARIHSADLIISNGLGLEEGLAKHLDSADVPLLEAGEVVETLEYATNGTVDPHFWTDPARVRALVPAIVDAIDETTGLDVSANAAAYDAQLADLDEWMTDSFAALPQSSRRLVTNHHVFGYLADRFDFEVVGAVIPGGSTLAAPSASDLRELVTAIDTTGVRTIFAESSQPDRLVQVLADEADLDVAVVELYTESLTEPGGDAATYLAMMRVNTDRIAQGLSP